MKPEKVVIITDSYKGSATSHLVGTAIAKGIKKLAQDAIIEVIPIADGGEGTVEALVEGTKGSYIEKEVTGPLGNRIKASYGMKDHVAFIEMAAASGLELVEDKELNPFKATTFGTGELVRDALDKGAKEIYIGLGGSATNDGGIGFAQALGVCFQTKAGNEINPGAEGIEELVTIDTEGLDKRLAQVKIIILSDVSNPLCGKNGASYVYGRQKGASMADLAVLDRLLFKYGHLLEKEVQKDIVQTPGAGAAGGLGAALLAFTEASMTTGIGQIMKLLHIPQKIKAADLVITGEGRLDDQTLNGKVPHGVAQITKKYQIPLIAVVGSQTLDVEAIYETGIDLVIDIINEPMTLTAAIDNVTHLLENAGKAAYQAFKMIKKYS